MEEWGEGSAAGVELMGSWLRARLGDPESGARVRYGGRARGGSHWWAIELPGEDPLWLAATEPALFEPQVRELPARLEAAGWLDALRSSRPDGVLVTVGARLFVWDRAKDRGTRLLDAGW